MADRNVWDPPTPPGHIEDITRAKVVELHIYSFPQSTKTRDAIRTDVKRAAGIWCQAKINVQAVRLEKLAGPLPSEPLDLNLSDLARHFACGNFADQFFGIPRPGNPDITRSIAVFYIPGDAFINGSGNGCHQYRYQGMDGQPEHIIIMTDGSDGRTLAHEIGHALLTRSIGSGQWTNEDPDPQQDPASPLHNLNPQNLMHPVVGQNPVVSAPQASQARQCLLVHENGLVSGFRENKPFKLGVKFKSINVKKTDDEAFSDDALESSWVFKASVLDANDAELSNKSHSWSKDPLHWFNYALDMDYLSVDLPTTSHKLRVSVNGTDWDFWSPNDDLAPIDQTRPQGTDKWGSGSMDPGIPNGQMGDHIGSASDDEIDYSVTFNIRLEQEPQQTTFRSVCA